MSVSLSGSQSGESQGVEMLAHPRGIELGVVHTSLLFKGHNFEAIEHWSNVEKNFCQTQAIDLVHLSTALDGRSV